MRFVSHFDSGGRTSQILQVAGDPEGQMRVIDTALAQEAILVVSGLGARVSKSIALVADQEDIVLSQTGARLNAAVLGRLMDAEVGTSVQMFRTPDGFVGEAYNTLTLDATTLILSRHGSNQMTVLRRDLTSGKIFELSTFNDTAVIDLTDFSAAAGSSWTFCAVSAQSDAILTYQLTPEGDVIRNGVLGKNNSLAVDIPNTVACVDHAGQMFYVIGSMGSSSITVLTRQSDGSFALADHVVDDRTTRFANLSILETIAVGDRMFVFAAGRDGGITLFELLRDGRLVFFDQWISSQNMDLFNIEKLDISIMNNDLSVVIHSSTSSQSRVFAIDISSLIGANPRDQIIYSTGHAIGGDGRDILVDGDGSDVLAGGEGADVFVLSADQTDDVILDFDPSQDKLDLSFWAMLYARDQLDIIPQDDGVQIVFGGERLSITFDPKSTLTMLTDRNFVFSAHYDMEFTGTNPIHVEIDPDPLGIDVVMAHSAGAFTLPLATDDEPPIAPHTPVISVDWPLSYSDTIEQMFSQNGAHRPTPITPQPRITFIGGDGVDLRVGGQGADNMLGLGGDDQLYGRAGNDILQGGDGNDQLFGGEGADTIVGGAGHDYLYGGAGADRFVFFPVTTGDLDLIADFDLGQDKIQFHHAKNFNLSQMSDLVMHDVVGGVWIDVWGSVIQLRDVHSWDLTDAHFEFLA